MLTEMEITRTNEISHILYKAAGNANLKASLLEVFFVHMTHSMRLGYGIRAGSRSGICSGGLISSNVTLDPIVTTVAG